MISGRNRSFWVGCSVTAIAAFSAAPALAACVPYPTQANTTTSCTGNITGGLTVNSNGSTLLVEEGSSVAGGSSPAITTTTGFSTLRINGAISGATGILVQNEPRYLNFDPYAGAAPPSGIIVYPYVYPSGAASIIVDVNGSIGGNVAIRIAQGPNNGLGNVSAAVDNSGTISSAVGAAIQGSGTNTTFLSSIINRSTGTIAGIDAPITSLQNAGLIDGGLNSALSIRPSPSDSISFLSRGSVENSGTIISRSADATIASANGFQSVINSGIIGNDGTGPVINTTGGLFLRNTAEGTIRSSGVTVTGLSLTLENRGRITGSILVAGAGQNLIDSVGGGVIQGNVTLGAGDDVVLAEMDTAGALSTGISGLLDGGAGINAVRLNLDADYSFTQPLTLPTNFQRLDLRISDDAKVTLAQDFTAPSTLLFSGEGHLINESSLSAEGPLFIGQGFGYLNELNFSNLSSITATLSDPSATAVKLSGADFDNQGTISATGGNAIDLTGSGVNGGTIQASGTALTLSGEFENSGSISSYGGAAIILDGTAPFRNLSGGTISGNGVAIARVSNTYSYVTFSNAGTINGNVNLSGTFTQLGGGEVNGDVIFGAGNDRFAAELRQGASPLGVSGTVDGGDGYDELTLRATADVSLGLNLASNFEQTHLEVDDGATLIVTSRDLGDQALLVSGNGTLDLNVDLGRTNGAALDATAVSVFSDSETPPVSGGTDIISRGSVQVTQNVVSFPLQPAISLGADDNLTNFGTIALQDNSAPFFRGAAIRGGDTVTNNGSITTDGANGIVNATTVINTGSIRVRETLASPFNTLAAISGSQMVTNSGSILLDGANGIVGASTVINSGTIGWMQGGTAGVDILNVAKVINSGSIGNIEQTSIAFMSVENQVGGTIGEIRTRNSQILNAGTIEGDVILGSFGTNTFVNAGGHVVGDIRSADSNSFSTLVFVNRQAGDDGVAGTIDAGLGLDSYITSFSSTGSYNLDPVLPAGFEFGGVEALGVETTVTLTSADSAVASEGVALLGNGRIINDGNIGPVSLEGAGLPDGVQLIARTNAVRYVGDVGKTMEFTPFFGSGSSILYGSALSSFTNNGTIDGDIRVATASFTNTGEIALLTRDPGTVIRTAADADFVFTNSGSITRANNGARAFMDYYDPQNATINIRGAIDSTAAKAVSVANSGEIVGGFDLSSLVSSFTFDNSGTISGMTVESGGPFFFFTQYVEAVRLGIGGTPFALEELEANATTATISNSGLIDGGITAELASLDANFVNDGEITKRQGDPGAVYLDVFAYDAEGEDGNETIVDVEKLNFVNRGRIGGTVAIDAEARAIIGSNTGTIAADNSGLASFYPVVIPAFGIQNETVASNTLSFDNSGSISTSEYASPGLLLYSAAGIDDDHYDADLSLPPIEGAAKAQIIVQNSGTIRSSGGEFSVPSFFGSPPQLIVAQSAGLVAVAQGVGATSVSIDNRVGGVIDAVGAPHFGTFGGVMPIGNAPENAGGIAIAASADSVTIRNEGQIIGGPAILFDPAIVTTSLPSGLDVGGLRGGAIDTIHSKDLVVNTATGSIIGGIALRDGDDRLENYGSIDGNVYLGDGDDQFVHGIAATFTGTADGGAGTDGLVIDITGGGTLHNALFDQFVGFEAVGFTGNGSIQTEGPVALDSLALSDGQLEVNEGTMLQTASATAIRGDDTSDESVVNRGTINGDIALAGGNDGVENHALIAGDVSLGDGSDQFTYYDGSTVAGLIDGGAGSDRLRLNLGGHLFDFAPFENFEELDVDQGTGSYAGELAFDVVNINGGRLIGLGGSTLTTGDINVGAGATFGSAGTVNGDVNVLGTLSPGASPGTMIVNGDVALASGSNTLFEMTPTVSDALIIHGGLTIATGATFTLTGERPLTPGISYDLIVTDDGITGSFTTINKAATVLGFLRQSADRIQLLGQFQLAPGSNVQVSTTVNYLNSLLIGGSAPAGLIDAVPTLLTVSGFADPAKMARLNPEPYASASQIGVENGLALVSALRSNALAIGKDDAGLFGFGQGFGSWRRLPGSAAVGTSSANIRNHGFLGGIGFGSQGASVGAFVGYIDARQRIGALGASTDADGVVAGLIAQAKLGGFELGAIVLRDGSSADTERSLASGTTATSHYKLRGWTADLNAGYVMPIGAGWTLRPEIGFTHISSRRGAADESGAGALSLNIDTRRTKASFVSGSLILKGDVAAKVRPWLTAGIRHQIEGRHSFATASLTGVTPDFTVPGASRSATLATVSAGLSAAISAKAEIFAGANSEFGGDSSGESANLGLRLRF